MTRWLQALHVAKWYVTSSTADEIEDIRRRSLASNRPTSWWSRTTAGRSAGVSGTSSATTRITRATSTPGPANNRQSIRHRGPDMYRARVRHQEAHRSIVSIDPREQRNSLVPGSSPTPLPPTKPHAESWRRTSSPVRTDSLGGPVGRADAQMADYRPPGALKPRRPTKGRRSSRRSSVRSSRGIERPGHGRPSSPAECAGTITSGANSASASQVGPIIRLEEGPAQMEPTYHCVDLIDARELPRVSADIDYARMPTAGQHHQPFAGNVEDQGLIIEDKWVGLP